jgi:glycosyltransferase involved in cell wall biosynthesis
VRALVTEPLRVLVLGPGAAAASDALRFEAFVPHLAKHAVVLVNWTPAEPTVDAGPLEALEAAIGWSDVVVLRRHYRTWHSCLACGFRTMDAAEAGAHGNVARHAIVLAPYFAIRPLIGLLESEPGVLGGRAIVYDTDDDFFSADRAGGADDMLERDLVERILRLADLVTTSTPVLAERMSSRARVPVRVLRNALDPSWYEAGRPDGPDKAPGNPRVVYHGASARLRDYELARTAVDAVAREIPSLRRVWLGGDVARLGDVVDEVRPWVSGLPAFAASLVAARPDIGLAPLTDSPYNRARSELHWLEYALAGAPTIVSGFAGPNPYDVVRDGVDALVARSPADWERHLRSLAASEDLRATLAGRARERVMAEYTVADRAAEWADAYRWAAAHAGVAQPRTAVSGS